MTESSIIFIGPMGVGKTSVAKKAAETLGMKYIDVDALRWRYLGSQKDYDGSLGKDYFKTGRETGNREVREG